MFPFWRAVLGYRDRGDTGPVEELNDPHRRKPVVCFQQMAPSWWVLADPEANEACVATWIGTDGRGYP